IPDMLSGLVIAVEAVVLDGFGEVRCLRPGALLKLGFLKLGVVGQSSSDILAPLDASEKDILVQGAVWESASVLWGAWLLSLRYPPQRKTTLTVFSTYSQDDIAAGGTGLTSSLGSRQSPARWGSKNPMRA